MDYHPKNILVTCVYLACKVDEFNVSMDQFVFNIKGDRQKAADIILNNELLLMQQLKYHLNVHSPIRPIEGFLIDIKVSFRGFFYYTLDIFPFFRHDFLLNLMRINFALKSMITLIRASQQTLVFCLVHLK